MRCFLQADALPSMRSIHRMSQQDALLALALCNDVARAPDGRPLGVPTEVALWQAAIEAGNDKAALEECTHRVWELPFDSEQKWLTTLHRNGSASRLHQGARQTVLDLARRWRPGKTRCRSIAREPCALPGHGKGWPSNHRRGLPALGQIARHSRGYVLEHDLTLLGTCRIAGLARDETKDAVATCRAAELRL